MKLCILTSAYPGQGGVATHCGPWWLLDFISELTKRDHNVFVITVKHKGSILDKKNHPAPVYSFNGGLKDEKLSELTFGSLQKTFLILRFLIKGIFFSLKKIIKEKPDHILVCWAVPTGIFVLPLKWLFGFSYSTFSLGSDVWNIDSYPFGPFILKLIFKNAQARFADGFGLSTIVEKISDKKCFFAATTRALDTTKFYNIPQKANIIKFLFVGRYNHDKGIDLLLEAWKLLVEKRKFDYHFLYLFNFEIYLPLYNGGAKSPPMFIYFLLIFWKNMLFYFEFHFRGRLKRIVMLTGG